MPPTSHIKGIPLIPPPPFLNAPKHPLHPPNPLLSPSTSPQRARQRGRLPGEWGRTGKGYLWKSTFDVQRLSGGNWRPLEREALWRRWSNSNEKQTRARGGGYNMRPRDPEPLPKTPMRIPSKFKASVRAPTYTTGTDKPYANLPLTSPSVHSWFRENAGADKCRSWLSLVIE